jgi:predicted RNA-binding protein with PUA-like domain
MAPRYWLLKSEPQVFSIDDLQRDGRTGWEGVRNYQARNFMRDEMKEGDLALFYHSNAPPPGVAGLARVVGTPRADPSQFDPKSPYFDASSSKASPRWVMATVAFVERFNLVPLEVLKADPALAGMALLQKGQRLSVQPVSPGHFARVLKLAKAKFKDNRRDNHP